MYPTGYESPLPFGFLYFTLPVIFYQSDAAPAVTAITPNVTVAEGGSVLLVCTGEDAHAPPEVKWTSPLGEFIKVSPNAGQKKWRTDAIWFIARIQSYQSGVYTCEASDGEKKTSKRTLVTVVRTNETLTAVTVDLFAQSPVTYTASADAMTPEMTSTAPVHRKRTMSIVAGISTASVAIVALLVTGVILICVIRRRNSSMAYHLAKHNDSINVTNNA